jgi:hypothetical protein
MLETCAKDIKYGLEIKGPVGLETKALCMWIIKHGPSIGVGQGIICTLYILESGLVATFVRVMLAGQLAISSLDFVGSGVFIYAQGLVGILHKKKKQTAL